MARAAAPCLAERRSFKKTHTGTTTSYFTNTSMATRALALERATRLAGPDSSPSSCNRQENTADDCQPKTQVRESSNLRDVRSRSLGSRLTREPLSCRSTNRGKGFRIRCLTSRAWFQTASRVAGNLGDGENLAHV